jgi:nitrogen fixation protein NifU and related proteins
MDLYNKIILELNRDPPNYTVREDAKHEVRAYNSYCGDKFKIHFDFKDWADKIAFQGHGCAVSKASTAILTECIQGKRWREIHDICVTVLDYLSKGDVPSSGSERNITDIDERLESFAVVRDYPGRYECAALCWEEMRKYCLKELDHTD